MLRRAKNCLQPAAGVLVLGALLQTGPLVSQQTDRQHGIFSETIDVTLVNLEIVATDPRGNPVNDLTQDEFRVFEDGEPVELSYFTGIETEDSELLGGELELETGSGRAPTPAEGPAERKHAIILVDNAHLSPANRNVLLARMRDELSRLMDGNTWAMVVSKDRDIRIAQRSTNDHELVDAALERIQTTGAKGGMLTASSEKLLQGLISRGDAPGVPGAQDDATDLLTSIDLHARSVAQAVLGTCEVLGYFVKSLSGVPGRKALFYISDGMPIAPGLALFQQWWNKWGFAFGPGLGVLSPQNRAEEYGTQEKILELIAEAAASRVSFYPIDSSRGGPSRAVSAANTDLALAGQILSSSDTHQTALGLLAQSTGGRAILDSSGLGDLIGRAQQDFGTTYELGFVSRFRGDGEIHKIKVETTRKGVKLRYLDRYRSKNRDQLASDRTLAALYLDDAANPLDVRVEIGQPIEAEAEKRKKRKRKKRAKSYVVPLIVRLPLANLSLLPEGTTQTGAVTLFLVVQDSDGRTGPPIKVVVPIKIQNDKLVPSMNQLVGYKTKIQMRSGEQRIALGVRDEVSQVVSTLNLQINVGET